MFALQMKILLTLSLIITCCLPQLVAQPPTQLTVTVQTIRPLKGSIKLQMVDATNKEVFQKISAVTAKTLTLIIPVSKVGKYAINILHDKNNNNKLDTNILGIPTEGWGCSNDARGVMSAPKFANKLFSVSANKSIIINLVYY